jgi:hypothetical protein
MLFYFHFIWSSRYYCVLFIISGLATIWMLDEFDWSTRQGSNSSDKENKLAATRNKQAEKKIRLAA